MKKIRILLSLILQINKELSAGQKQAVTASLKHSVSLITGGPGTGKTTIIKYVSDPCTNVDSRQVTTTMLVQPRRGAAAATKLRISQIVRSKP